MFYLSVFRKVTEWNSFRVLCLISLYSDRLRVLYVCFCWNPCELSHRVEIKISFTGLRRNLRVVDSPALEYLYSPALYDIERCVFVLFNFTEWRYNPFAARLDLNYFLFLHRSCSSRISLVSPVPFSMSSSEDMHVIKEFILNIERQVSCCYASQCALACLPALCACSHAFQSVFFQHLALNACRYPKDVTDEYGRCTQFFTTGKRMLSHRIDPNSLAYRAAQFSHVSVKMSSCFLHRDEHDVSVRWVVH
jgi:hypothetical protein